MSSVDEVLSVFRIKTKYEYSLWSRAIASWFYQLKILTSYRMNLALDILDIIVSALIYYFISFLVSPDQLASLGYTPDYVAFAISGIALSRYIWTSVSRLAHKMRHEISAGTFESLVVIDTDYFKGWLIGQILYGFTWSSFWFVGTLIVGMFLGANFVGDPLLWLQALLILLLTVIVHSGIGVMAAGLYIKHKQLETLLVLMASVIEFFGGVLYPLSLLYNYPLLYYIALLIPFTHGLELFRRTITDGALIIEPLMLMHLGALLLFLPIFFLGFRVFGIYLDKARREGILSAY